MKKPDTLIITCRALACVAALDGTRPVTPLACPFRGYILYIQKQKPDTLPCRALQLYARKATYPLQPILF